MRTAVNTQCNGLQISRGSAATQLSVVTSPLPPGPPVPHTPPPPIHHTPTHLAVTADVPRPVAGVDLHLAERAYVGLDHLWREERGQGTGEARGKRGGEPQAGAEGRAVPHTALPLKRNAKHSRTTVATPQYRPHRGDTLGKHLHAGTRGAAGTSLPRTGRGKRGGRHGDSPTDHLTHALLDPPGPAAPNHTRPPPIVSVTQQPRRWCKRVAGGFGAGPGALSGSFCGVRTSVCL